MAPATEFLDGGGEMGARIRAYDWSSTPLGPPQSWPQSLRSALSICLNEAFPTAIYWGPDLRLLYNDAWAAMVSDRHPGALGRSAAEVWPDILDVVGPQMRGVLESGEGFATFDEMLSMERNGVLHETYWTYSFTPIRGENGGVAGVFNQAHETTDRVLGERRSRFLLELSDHLRSLSDPRQIIDEAQAALGAFLGANRVGYAEVDPTTSFVVTAGNWTDGSVTSLEGVHELSGYGPDVLEGLSIGTPLVIPDVSADARTNAPDRLAAFRALDIGAAITVSLVKDGRMRAVLYAHARKPSPWNQADAQIVLEVADRTWSAAARARAQDEVSVSQARLRTVVDSLPLGVGVIDLEGHTVLGNPEYRRLIGEVIPSKDLTRRNRWRAFDRYGLPLDRSDFPGARALRGEAVNPGVDMLYTDEDGREVWVNIATAPVTDESGRVISHVVAIMDIDALKRGAEALRESEARLRELNETLEQRVGEALAERRLLAEIVEGMDAFVQVIDPDFRVLAINRAAAAEIVRLYGVRPRVGDNLLQRLEGRPHAEDVTGVWRRALAGEAFSETLALKRLDGEIRNYELNVSPLRDAEGRQVGAYQFAYDVTQQVRDQQRLAETEYALQQSQKMEAMGQLTGGVAHDFNNLLTPILGSLDMLQQRVEGAREQRLIGAALQSAERAKTLVQRLLAFARRQPLQPVAVDVGKLMTSMAELVASTTGPQIKVTVDALEGLPAAWADPNQLEMALLNLAVNARDAMPGGGALRISAAAERVDAQHPSRLPPGDYIRLSVADTGVGMDEAVRTRAIEPFFSTKGVGKGTGLGLSMVHGLALQLGGALTIQSRPNLGTNVELWLPQSDVAPDEAQAAAPAQEVPGRGVALLVDDEDLVRMSTADMLQDLGWEVIEAGSAETALAMVETGLAFDLLVTDHLMPGLNGTDLAREIQARRPNVPVLVISGYAESEGIAPDLPRLAKPFRKDELAASLVSVH